MYYLGRNNVLNRFKMKMTAEKFLKSKKYPSYTNEGGYGKAYVIEAMIEFAKISVEEALRNASKQIKKIK